MQETPQIVVDAVRANTTGTAANPKIVTLASGRFLVAYSTETGGDGFFIRGRVFDAFGRAIGNENLFPFPNEMDEREFDIAALSGDRVVIATENVPFFADVTARVFHIDEDGDSRFVGGEISEFEVFGGEDFINPAVTALGEDSYRMLWLNHNRIAGVDLHFDGMNGEREQVEGGQRSRFIEGFRGGSGSTLDVDRLSNGNIVVVHDDGEGRRGQIDYCVVRSNGSTVKCGTTGDSSERTFHAKGAALADEGFVIVWTENDVDFDIEFQMFDANGNPRTGFRTIANTGIGDNNSQPAIAALDDGGFIIFYDKGSSPRQIRGQRFGRNGNRVGDDFSVASANGGQIDATVLPNGRVAVAFDVEGAGTIRTAILAVDRNVIRGTNGDDQLPGTNDADAILAGAGDDVAFGDGGDDIVDGGAGDDRVIGGDGADVVDGGAGDDRVFGGDGADVVDGGAGDDRVFGGGGDDRLAGGPGNDVLAGRAGSDTFIVRDGGGDDEIIDFDPTNATEVIDLSNLTAITDFVDLSANHMTQVNGDVVIDDLDGTTITLKSVDLGDLTAEDFLF